MEYRIARDGQTFGPYTEAEVRNYLVAGNIVETDLARTEDMDKWLPIAKILPKQKKAKRGILDPAGIHLDLPSPPDIPWWMMAALGAVTSFAFFVGWDVFEALWLRRVQQQSRALIYYSITALLFVVSAQEFYTKVIHSPLFAPLAISTHATFFTVALFAMLFVSRFSMRRSLLTHFNQAEPIGLRLSWFMTLLFGGLYFQYHFNRINELRRSLTAAPAPL